ncbi:tetratricopeptide repeat protein [Ancylobacter sp. 6x-1]|uniref:Tetratricopeptide repeat protein n=1 Tax=Ancylobacter crimeensis TaxID=2579147 RepID=A0ABT0D628_9HYPH|nr:tetratricopeptide repeat protein [Ancylobacter crimeensis]MCK0195402.1 tetratricopeptide repeat protein [Ancylobacter crimeensis]
MADIFNEIDEDLRRERLGKIWNRYGAYIVAFFVIVVLAVAGWSGYQWWTLKQEQASGARFAAALKLSTDGKHAEAAEAFEALAKDGTVGYRELARFRAAAELATTDKAKAVAAYDALATDTSLSAMARDVAQLRAGYLLVDTATRAEIEQRMAPLSTDTGALRDSAREVIGLAQYRAGDMAAAAKTFESILADPEAPPGVRQRAELMRSLATGGPAVDAPPSATIAPAPSVPMPEQPSLQLPVPQPMPGEEPAPPADGAASDAAPGVPMPDDPAAAAPAAAPPVPALPSPAEPASAAPEAAPEAPSATPAPGSPAAQPAAPQ